MTVADPKAILFCVSQCGLANRLRALIGYHAMSKLLGVPFFVQWKVDASCTDEFDSLLGIEEAEFVSLEQAKAILRSRTAAVFSSVPWFMDIRKQYFPEAACREFLSEVARSLDVLKPVECVRESVAAFAGRQESPEVGVHIRHTDNITGYVRWASDPASGFCPPMASGLEGFHRVMVAEAAAGRRFMLATDDPALESALSARYGGMLSVFPKQCGHLSAMQEALADMLLLAECRKVVGTYFSSFGQFGALWGDADFAEVQGNALVERPPFQQTIEEMREIRTQHACV